MARRYPGAVLDNPWLGPPRAAGRGTVDRVLAQDDIDALADAIDGGGLDGWSWLTAGIVFASAIVIAQGVRMVLGRALRPRLDRALAVLISRLVGYVIVIVGLVYALGALGVQIGPLLGALGIAGIALAFALQDILENFVAGVLLQIRRPFTYGDEVRINDHEGRVSGIDARVVTIDTPDGETVMVPSATVIKSDVVNYTRRGERRTDLPIGVAYGSDLSIARRALEGAVAGADGVLADPAPAVLLVGFGDSSIDFVVRFWHSPEIASFWRVRDTVAAAVDRSLADAGIEIPFPQRTVWFGDQSSAGS